MYQRIRILVVCFVWSFAVAILDADEPTTEEARGPQPSAQQIEQWVRDLNSNRFIDREFATQELTRAGMPAIGPILKAIPKGNVEVLTRAVHVLREIAVSEDEQVSLAGQHALEQVAASSRKTASRRALAALDKLGTYRQGRAIDSLRAAGVKLTNETVTVGRAFVFDVPTVDLENFDGDPQDLSQLKWLRDFRHVKMSGDGITDACVAHVATMKAPHYITIKRAAITDQSVQHLVSASNIQQLVIMYCPITDKAVENLAVHKTASHMKLFGTKITVEGAGRLQQAIAGTNVDRRDGAFLGVGCEAHERGCLIRVVHGSSAAAQAGIRQGDIITKFNGEFAKDFDTLTSLIGKHRGGATVEVEILRGEVTLKKMIKLGEWD